MSRFCCASSSAFSSSSALEACSAFCRFSSSAERSRSCSVSSCDCLSSTSVLVLTLMVLTLVAIISASWLRKSRWICVNGWNEASSITPSTLPSKSTGSTITCAGGASPEPRGDLQVARRHVVDLDRPLLLGRRPDQRLAGPERGRHRTGGVAVTAAHAQLVRAVPAPPTLRAAARRHGQEERAVLRRDHRRQLAHDQRGHVVQVAAALHQAGDPGQVALEPVLLLVGEGGVAQVRDHRVDVVLEDLDLAGRVHVDLEVQVAAGHRGGDRGDRAHLPGQVPGHLVHRLGQVAPGARRRPAPGPDRPAAPRCPPRGPPG